MDKQKLKEELHQYIDNLEDETTLNMLHEATIEYQRADKGNITDELTPKQLERLNESLEQLKNGQTKSHEEVMKLARTWVQK